MKRSLLLVALFSLVPALALGAGGHGDPSAPTLLALAVLLGGAKLGAELAVRFKQATVLGELLFGVLLGNLGLVGFSRAEWIGTDATVGMLAQLGVVLLLFEVGLESTVGQMLRVGWSAVLVAAIGVTVPFALGWGAGALLLPSQGPYANAFLGVMLTATSVGITARVLKDLGRSQSQEARIILGAAVIDDVLGLVGLALITSLVEAANEARALSAGEVGATIAKAVAFLVGAVLIGAWASPRIFRLAAKFRAPGVLFVLSLVLCFVLSYGANAIGLVPIVGAFAAGLVLEEGHFESFHARGELRLDALLRPVSSLLVPLFFVVIGMRTDLRVFAKPSVLLLAAALCVVALLGKHVSGIAVLGRGVDRLTVGIGMAPRGEVVLIFANVGMGLTVAGRPVVSQELFSAIMAVVIVTTLATPLLLTWSTGRARRREKRSATHEEAIR